MKNRPFGTTGFDVSALGFGCMRLPTTGSDQAIDAPQAIAMIRHAIDEGVTYVDTAHGYHGGNSECVLGDALRDGYRARVKVATKMPIWDVKVTADFDRLFDEQLARLQTDHIDCYLLHNLQAPSWPRIRDLGALEWLQCKHDAGQIGEMGFSFHDGYDTFVEIIDAFDGWSFCQIQYNYMNEDVQAGTRGLEYAASKGLAVIIMEPLLGGCLAQPPDDVAALLASASRTGTAADWALQWLWNKPEVSLVLSGMSTMEQVEQNLASAGRSGVGSLRQEDLDLVARLRQAYESKRVVPCTRCGYCMPCPEGVDIPRNFQLYNDALIFEGNQAGLSKNLYVGMSEGMRASACIACGACEEKCPQSITVSEWMPKVNARFTS